MENFESVKLTIPNDLVYFELAQLFAREMAKMIGFKGNELNEIDIALEESVTFVMTHAYDKEEDKTIDIICQKIEKGLKIIVKDMGIPFDPNRIARFEITKNPDDLSFEGLGIYLLQKVVDDLSFHNLGHMGKEIHIVKYLPQLVPQMNLPPDHGQIGEDLKVITSKIDFEVRAMQPEEAIEVSRCAYKSHGYSFFDDHIYFPERLVEMNQNLEMISAVAVTLENEFMGHAALLFEHPGDTIAELTFFFVNIEYRGQGALGRMVNFLLKVPKKRELTGIYGYAVANHPFTQKSFARISMKDCGILLATSPASWKFKGISEDTSQRISVVLSFMYMKEAAPLTLYPPAHHQDMITKIYASLSVSHHFSRPESREPSFSSTVSDIFTELNELESCAGIYIFNYGENILHATRKILRSFCVSNIASINLFLNLADPLTWHLTGEFEKMGFFFAGVLPQSQIGDALVLQYLNNVAFDYNKLVLYSDFTKEIMEYIRRNDPNEII
jgi:anti-sigma regulatory factor (Ser/Thr protein kinase)